MPRDDRDERRARRLAVEDAAPTSTWLARRLIPYGAVLTFLGGVGLFEGDPGVAVPMMAVGIFWGMGIARAYVSRLERLRAAGLTQAPSGEAPRVETPEAPRQVAAGRVPEAVADVAAAVAKVGEGLRKHGRPKVAETLERGLGEVIRLATLTAVVRPEDLAELREEIAGLRDQAEAAPDAETAELWAGNAATAERRLEKLLALDAAAGRTRARIEAFRQAVKSLAVDLARLDLAGAEGGALPQVDDHAVAIERDVEALVRTRAEMDRLERGPAVVRASADGESTADVTADDPRRRARAAQRTM